MDRRELVNSLSQQVTDLIQPAMWEHIHQLIVGTAQVPLDYALYRAFITIAGLSPTRVQDAARGLGLNQSTMSRHSARLEGLGLIQRSQDASDGRVTLLKLTDQGALTLQRLDQARLAVFTELVDGWDAAQIGALLTSLGHLLQPMHASRTIT